MRHYRLLRGWLRLRFGFCPSCNSSPPDPQCGACFGDRVYGEDATKARRGMWWRNYKSIVRRNA